MAKTRMSMNYRGDVFELTDLTEARRQVGTLDVAAPVQLMYKLPDGTPMPVSLMREMIDDDEYYDKEDGVVKSESMYGMMNLSTMQMAKVVTGEYKPLLHADMLNTVLDALHESGLYREAQFRVENNGNRAAVEAFFPQMRLNDREEGMAIGLRFQNSYDTSLAFDGALFLLRYVCINGIYWWTEGGAHLHLKHTRDAMPGDIHDKVVPWIDKAFSRVERLQDKVEDLMAREVRFSSAKQLHASLSFIFGGRKTIPEEVFMRIPLRTTNWEIYQAITWYTSHVEGISHILRDRINKRAEHQLWALPELPLAAVQEAEAI